MSPRRPFECQFAVGVPEAEHSMVWKTWANKRAPDLYITARPMGGALKASIHGVAARDVQSDAAEKDRHFGFTQEYVTCAIRRGDWQGGSRHYDQWKGGYPLERGATLEFLIRFPTIHLRQFPLRKSDRMNIVWVPAAPIDAMVEVAFLYFPPDLRPEFHGESGARVVYKGMLADSRQVWLVARNVPTGQSDTFREIQAGLLNAGITPATINAGHRLTISFNDSGVRGWTELAVDSIFESTEMGMGCDG